MKPTQWENPRPPGSRQAGWDHIVVGAGSAGSVIAARLAGDPNLRVLLLESGADRPSDPPRSHPLRVARAMVLEGYNWDHRVNLRSGPAPARARWARFPYPLGRGVGGSSAVNGAVALRALPSDFDAWVGHGNPDWSWDRVLPYFRRIEHDPQGSARTGGSALHGVDGPLPINRPDRIGPLDEALRAACIRRGVPDRPDLNDGSEHGVGPVPANVVDGIRMDAATAFLEPIRGRTPNLTVRTLTDVLRVIVSGGRVTGVEVRSDPGSEVLGTDQVTLCAGAVGTPPILLRSGIGSAELCRRLGVTVVADLPGVGRGLADHTSVVIWAVPRDERPEERSRWRDLLARTGSGVDDRADLQLGLITGVDPATIPGFAGRLAGRPVLGMSVMLGYPESVGQVTLRPEDPAGSPVIELGLGSVGADLDRLAAGVRIAWSLLNEPEIAGRLDGIQGWSAPTVKDPVVLRQAVRNLLAPAWHAGGTARMGPAGDRDSVVDQRCRVHGVDGLRVVDASVFPALPGTPTNLTTLMVADRISDEWVGP